MDIARRFNGEIINGDAMQLYRGLPIITNQISEDEMRGIPHHLLGCIGLEEETWTVGKFVEKALGVVCACATFHHGFVLTVTRLRRYAGVENSLFLWVELTITLNRSFSRIH